MLILLKWGSNNNKTVKDIVCDIIDDQIGMPPATVTLTHGDQNIFIRAGVTNRTEWMEVGEDIIKALDDENFNYFIYSACKTSVTIMREY